MVSMNLPEGRRQRRGGEGPHKVAVRKPTELTSSELYERFNSLQEAEDFVREVALTYPKGTLFFIKTADTDLPRRSYVVNERGKAVRRRTRWVPDYAEPLEWHPEVKWSERPRYPHEDIEGLEELPPLEKERIRDLAERLMSDEEREALRAYRKEQWIKRQGYFSPGELE